MSIRDIIETTAQVSGSSWTAKHSETDSWVESESYDIADQVSSQDAEYIATFDPEHQLLIDAVCEAAKNSALYDDAFGKSRPLALDALREATEALTAYRREKGLE